MYSMIWSRVATYYCINRLHSAERSNCANDISIFVLSTKSIH